MGADASYKYKNRSATAIAQIGAPIITFNLPEGHIEGYIFHACNIRFEHVGGGSIDVSAEVSGQSTGWYATDHYIPGFPNLNEIVVTPISHNGGQYPKLVLGKFLMTCGPASVFLKSRHAGWAPEQVQDIQYITIEMNGYVNAC